ncbi:MAG: sugar transporter permease [Clostridiales bacterium]|jgi:arabinogalactan oligomer/maltooligosaccharide transport system permease protein|nr:sugar transporter permease [Clostridiales bacterium]
MSNKKKKKWWQKLIGEKMTNSGWLSFFIFGLGQLKNKQKGKALILFAFQFAYVFIEVITSKLVKGVIPNQPEYWGYGFFRKGIHGFITLGETTGGRFRDNSPVMMIEGIMVFVLILIYIVIWKMNIKDANDTNLSIQRTGIVQSSKAFFAERFETGFAYIVSTPALLLLLFVSIVPILFAFLIAFTNYDAYHNPPSDLIDWVGFANFFKVIKLAGWRTTFAGVASWTVIWAILSTMTTFFGGLLLAVVINSKRVVLKKMWRTIMILPWAIPGMISLLVFRNFFNQTYGPLNAMLGMDIPWLNDPIMVKVTLVIINFWLGVPYFMMLMTGILTSFDKTLYEAATVDGANSRQTFWSITFPILSAQVFPLLIMSFAGNFNNFGIVFFLTGGGPRNLAYEYAGHSDILITWIYNMTKDFKMYNMASVMSIIIFLIIGGISTWNFLRSDAFKEDN